MNGCADIVSSAALPGSAACCGCGACRAVCPVGAITMKPDKEGFLRPAVDAAKCVNCGKCAAVCPVLHPGPKREPLAVSSLVAPRKCGKSNANSVQLIFPGRNMPRHCSNSRIWNERKEYAF